MRMVGYRPGQPGKAAGSHSGGREIGTKDMVSLFRVIISDLPSSSKDLGHCGSCCERKSGPDIHLLKCSRAPAPRPRDASSASMDWVEA